MKKKIDKEKTLEKIYEWESQSIAHDINYAELDLAMARKNWATKLKKMAEFCGVEVVYEN